MWDKRKVQRVVSGNTFLVHLGKQPVHVRLANVSLRDQHDEVAREALTRLIGNQVVQIKTVAESVDGSKVAQVTTKDDELVNDHMRQKIKQLHSHQDQHA